MTKHIDVEKLTTISECLAALMNISQDLEDIKIQLDYREGSPEWRYRAGYALRKVKNIRSAIQMKLAILRQEEKQRNIATHARSTDYLVKELVKHVSPEVFAACAATANEIAEREVAEQMTMRIS